MILGQQFFARPAPLVAQELLGCTLAVGQKGKEVSGVIIETEAYDGPDDTASHAHKGRTSRTEMMFGPAGFWYVYLIYGMHWMLNIVTGPREYPAAVLIRAIKAQEGVINGPAKLTRYFGIDKRFNGTLADLKTGLWIEARKIKIAPSSIDALPRVGVDYATREWRDKPYRFVLDEGAQPHI